MFVFGQNGNLVEMGSTIDQMDDSSKPDFYENINTEEAIVWSGRRIIKGNYD